MIPGDLETGERLLTSEEVAAAAGLTVRSLHTYLRAGPDSRGYAPQADGHIGRTPVWRQSTVDEWVTARAG